MKSRWAYVAVVSLGVVILAVRALFAGPTANPTPSPSPSRGSIESPRTSAQASDSGGGPVPTPSISGTAADFVVIDNSPEIPYDQAKAWGTALINSTHLLRLAITGDQPSTVISLEQGTAPYSTIVTALQNAQANKFTPTMSADLVVSQAILSDLPDSDKSYISRWHQTPTNQAWLVTYQTAVTVTYGSNHQTFLINQNYAVGGYVTTNSSGTVLIAQFSMDCSGIGASLTICQLAG